MPGGSGSGDDERRWACSIGKLEPAISVVEPANVTALLSCAHGAASAAVPEALQETTNCRTIGSYCCCCSGKWLLKTNTLLRLYASRT